MRKPNIFKPIPFYLKYKTLLLLYITVIALEFFLVLCENLPEPRIKATSDINTFEALFIVISGQSPETDTQTAENCEFFKYLILYTCWVTMFTLQFGLPLLFIYRGVFIRRRMKSIKEFCLMDTNLIEKLSKKKHDYLELHRQQIEEDAKNDISKMFPLKINLVLAGLNHPNFFLEEIPAYVPHTTLKHFMLGEIDWCYSWGFIVMIRYIKDVLKGIQYLHEHNIYHLNLHPANIAVMNTERNDKGNIAKIGNFEFAKICSKKKISLDKVGLPDIYRPPECFTSKEVDAEKIDCWSVGITAFELFTGGILTIEADSLEYKSTSYNEIKMNSFLEQKYFASALEASWGLYDFLDFIQILLGHFSMLCDLNDAELVPDCWNFVQGLLHFDPKMRITIQRALNTPLMKKVHIKHEKPKNKVVLV